MQAYIYQGEPVNLGRFGAVKKGDVVVLTDDEAKSIEGDKRFKATKNPQPVVVTEEAETPTPAKK